MVMDSSGVITETEKKMETLKQNLDRSLIKKANMGNKCNCNRRYGLPVECPQHGYIDFKPPEAKEYSKVFNQYLKKKDDDIIVEYPAQRPLNQAVQKLARGCPANQGQQKINSNHGDTNNQVHGSQIHSGPPANQCQQKNTPFVSANNRNNMKHNSSNVLAQDNSHMVNPMQRHCCNHHCHHVNSALPMISPQQMQNFTQTSYPRNNNDQQCCNQIHQHAPTIAPYNTNQAPQNYISPTCISSSVPLNHNYSEPFPGISNINATNFLGQPENQISQEYPKQVNIDHQNVRNAQMFKIGDAESNTHLLKCPSQPQGNILRQDQIQEQNRQHPHQLQDQQLRLHQHQYHNHLQNKNGDQQQQMNMIHMQHQPCQSQNVQQFQKQNLLCQLPQQHIQSYQLSQQQNPSYQQLPLQQNYSHQLLEQHYQRQQHNQSHQIPLKQNQSFQFNPHNQPIIPTEPQIYNEFQHRQQRPQIMNLHCASEGNLGYPFNSSHSCQNANYNQKSFNGQNYVKTDPIIVHETLKNEQPNPHEQNFIVNQAPVQTKSECMSENFSNQLTFPVKCPHTMHHHHYVNAQPGSNFGMYATPDVMNTNYSSMGNQGGDYNAQNQTADSLRFHQYHHTNQPHYNAQYQHSAVQNQDGQNAHSEVDIKTQRQNEQMNVNSNASAINNTSAVTTTPQPVQDTSFQQSYVINESNKNLSHGDVVNEKILNVPNPVQNTFVSNQPMSGGDSCVQPAIVEAS